MTSSRSNREDGGPLNQGITGAEHSFDSAVPRVSSRCLDFLRGGAAVYVLFGHARGHLFAGGANLAAVRELNWFDYVILALLQLTSMGTEAVMVFFVLSGFAMAHSFSHSDTPMTFYKKRALRIWPPYLASIGVAFLCAAIILRSPEPNGVTTAVKQFGWGLKEVIELALYIKVDSELTAQFWSLPHEVIFYALCPLLMGSKSRVLLFLGCSIGLTAVGAMTVGIYNDPTIGEGILYQHFFSLLVFFMVGATAYHYQHLIPRMTSSILYATFMISFVLIWFLKYQIFAGWNLITSLLTIPISLLLIGNVPPSLYDNKWLNWGRYSYSLYLIHMQLIVLTAYVIARIKDIEQRDMTSYWMWVLVIPPILLFNSAFYSLVEKRCNSALIKLRAREIAAMEA